MWQENLDGQSFWREPGREPISIDDIFKDLSKFIIYMEIMSNEDKTGDYRLKILWALDTLLVGIEGNVAWTYCTISFFKKQLLAIHSCCTNNQRLI